MAYIKKYSFPFATKFEQDSVLELWEDTADTTVYEFQGVSFQIQYIPSSDDPFEAIFATQLAVTINVTDDTTGNTSAFIPNLVTLNDKKYLAKLFIGGNQVFTGWTLSDSVSLAFTTGIKELSFNCVDGLAMLKDIKFSNNVTFDTNARVSLLSFISNILLNTGLSININTSVSYYAEGMLDRSDGTQYEPFSQTYVYGNSFIDNDGEFEDCYTILEKIVKSFGARIFQANNEWNIISVNQFAFLFRYFTRYNANGTYLTSGFIDDNNVEIQPYLNNTSNFYFIDNSQTKLMKKGYNNIISNNNIEYSGNFLYNWTLKHLSSGFPLGWEKVVTGNGIVNLLENIEMATNSIQLVSEAITSGTAKAQITSKIAFARGTKVKVAFDISKWGTTTSIAAKVVLIVSDGTNTYHYTANDEWFPYPVGTDFYRILVDTLPTNTNEIPESFTLTTTPLPFGGELTFGILLDDSTGDEFICTNFEIGVESLFKSVNISARLTNEDTYTLKVNDLLGVPANYGGFFNYKGFLMLSDGTIAKNWYRYEYPLEIFRGLAQLLVRQYSNIYQKNIINLDCNLSSLDTNKGIISSANLITIGTDTDPSSINIEDDSYIFGNTTIDIATNEIQSTLLQISNINVEGITIETVYNNGDVRNDFPEGCYCWRLTAVIDNTSYNYTDCSGVYHSGIIPFTAETIYVQSPVAPLIEGTTAVLVDSSYCSI